jgi:integrase
VSVYRRQNGVYMADFTYLDPLTKRERRFRRSAGTTVKKEAEALERAWRAEVETPTPPPSAVKNTAAFSGFALHWLTVHVAVNCKPSYYRSSEQALRVHLVPAFGDADLRSITVEAIEKFKAAEVKTGASPKSINNRLGILGSMYTCAIKWRYAEVNPVHQVKPLRLPPGEMLFWTAEQSDAFLEAVRRVRPPWYTFFLAALRTGLRLGELLGLQWGDVDFVTSEIHVRRNWTHGALVTPKSGKGRRVPMSPELAHALRGYKHLNNLVFCDKDGSYLDRNRVKHPFWSCIRAAGVREIRIHDLRHSFASQLVMRGVPLAAVKELLGHATIEMTMRYAHLSPGATQDYVGMLDSSDPLPTVTETPVGIGKKPRK